jgi:hypothetical protein
LSQVTSKALKQNFCVKDFKFQVAVSAEGIEGSDGILGLSPKDFGTHSFIPSLKRAGLIDRMMISFDNAFSKGSFKYYYHPDDLSYMIFGGVNETQIIGGLKGLYNMPLATSDLNTDRFWGVEGQGFLYGNKFLQNPSKDKPILAVIDSGTTLVMIPRK